VLQKHQTIMMCRVLPLLAAFAAILALASAQEAPQPGKQMQGVICDHAAPPVGMHYECTPGNTCDCRLVRGAVFQEDDGKPAPGPQAAPCSEPVVVRFVAPEYPKLARAARVQGTVVARIHYDEKGIVSAAELVRGHAMLAPSVETLKQWTFKPTGKTGTLEVQLVFTLGKKLSGPDKVSATLPYLVRIEGHPLPAKIESVH
jgi:hypothetical protein